MICQRQVNLFSAPVFLNLSSLNVVKTSWVYQTGLKWEGAVGSCSIFSKAYNGLNLNQTYSFYDQLINFILIQNLQSGIRIWTRGLSAKGKVLLLGLLFWGYSSMLQSFIYTNILSIKVQGVGYKIFIKNFFIMLEMGLTHRIFISIPKGLYFVSPEDSKNQSLFIIGFCKVVVFGFGSFLRNLKKPDIYKGKGLHFFSEIAHLKKGKKKE